ncbi:anti-sigma regulatory factor [Coriobacteriaceae bacterium EMTCatB1]|nr:anti-sigma regulatory factor [Coriobacteriaceae bacterium EMTCatB1]
MSPEQVTLTVPARSEYARTVRMTASELAVRLGMAYDRIEDVRMAADEAFVYACARSGPEGTVVFQFELAGDALTMCVGPISQEQGSGSPLDDAQGRYAAFILEAVCDTFVVEPGDDGTRLRIVKRASGDEE